MVSEGPKGKAGVAKLWKRYNLHEIRETCRSIRVSSGTIEVKMVTNGKVNEAQDTFALLRNQVEELRILLEGKK
jgi:hypothetical protein